MIVPDRWLRWTRVLAAWTVFLSSTAFAQMTVPCPGCEAELGPAHEDWACVMMFDEDVDASQSVTLLPGACRLVWEYYDETFTPPTSTCIRETRCTFTVTRRLRVVDMDLLGARYGAWRDGGYWWQPAPIPPGPIDWSESRNGWMECGFGTIFAFFVELQGSFGCSIELWQPVDCTGCDE